MPTVFSSLSDEFPLGATGIDAGNYPFDKEVMVYV